MAELTKYRVSLFCTGIVRSAWVKVEAETEEQAASLALALAEEAEWEVSEYDDDEDFPDLPVVVGVVDLESDYDWEDEFDE